MFNMQALTASATAQDFEATFADTPVWKLPYITASGLYQVEIAEAILGLSKYPDRNNFTRHYVRLLGRATLAGRENYTGQVTLFVDLDIAPNVIAPQYSNLLCAAKCYKKNPQTLEASVNLRQNQDGQTTLEYVPELEGKTLFIQIEASANDKFRARKFFDDEQLSPLERVRGQAQPEEFNKLLAMQPKEPSPLRERERQATSQVFAPPTNNIYQSQSPAIQAPNTPWTAAAAQQMQQAQAQQPMTPAAMMYSAQVAQQAAAPMQPVMPASMQQVANVNNPYMTNAQDSGDIPF